MIYDFHIHTKFSVDSKEEILNYVKAAKERGISMLCFTDHVDYNPNDYGYQFYDPEGFFNEIEKVRKNLDDNIEICTGIEFAEPHLYPDKLSKLKEYPYDFIIGSIHWINDMFPNKEVREKYSEEKFFEMYWKEVKNAVTAGGFDCLGHLDFPKRYYGKVIYYEDMMKDIFTTMLHNNILLEINTSSLRKGMNSSMPDKELLNLYKKCGGRYVTIGSDAHSADELAADYDYAVNLVKFIGIKRAVYKNRKLIIIEDYNA